MLLGFSLSKSVRYAVMPEIVTRINHLVMGGFDYIPYFIATVYHMVRLLPANHPYANPRNIGRFGIRHVVAEAANHLVIDRHNIDKILLFVLVLVGLALVFIQFCILALTFVFSPAMAFPVNFLDFFRVDPVSHRSQDLAFMMLDMVFGVPHPSLGGPGVPANMGFFESCIGSNVQCQDNFGTGIPDTNTGGTALAGVAPDIGPLSTGAYLNFPFPIHRGLHQLFAVYSNGLLVVAVVIASYFVATVLAETAQSGTPFGRRFNKMWAPLRIVMAFGLLVPLTVGLNSSQYIVLYSAKWGSAFATNGWKYFNDVLTTDYFTNGGVYRLISTPTLPDVAAITQFMWVINVCKHSYQFSASSTDPDPDFHPPDVQMYYVLAQRKTPNAIPVAAGTGYNTVLNNYEDNNTVITIRFGERDETEYPKEQGHVKPYCGEVQLKLSDPRVSGDAEPGPYQIQEFYWNLIRNMWFNENANPWSGGFVAGGGNRARFEAWTNMGKPGGTCPGACGVAADTIYFQQVNANIKASLDTTVTAAVSAQILSGRLSNGPFIGAGDPVYRKGWAAAGIWYNRISEMNAPVAVSTRSLPQVSLYPLHMEEVKKKKAQYNMDTSMLERFKPTMAGVDDAQTLLSSAVGQQLAASMHAGFVRVSNGLATSRTKATGNPFFDMIKSILGTSGLYDMRRNNDVHPLAQLVGIGRSLVESSIQAMGYGMWSSFAGIAAGLADWGGGATLGATLGSFFFSVAMIGLTAGFVLFYVVPFLPFIYFFFAVGGWIKGIFEAMVGAPLWALAHIRIDAQGLSGNAALNGYFLIFEVFLRPILVTFGLIASVATYSALVSALNNVFDIVIHNTGGFDIEAETTIAPPLIDSMRGPIDEFFFTVIYAIIVYMMGMSSFKLIDTIPNNILRWMGQSVASFGDQREDPAQGLVGRSAIGAQQTLSRLDGGLQGIASLGRRV